MEKMNRGAMVMLPIGVAAGVYAGYVIEQDRLERQAFEDALFQQVVAEEKEKERKERELKAAEKPRPRGFWR